MRATSFKEVNKVIGKPSSMTDQECEQLALAVSTHPQERWPSLISKWLITDEEIEVINECKAIWAIVAGTNLPPMRLEAHHPFKSFGYEPLPME